MRKDSASRRFNDGEIENRREYQIELYREQTEADFFYDSVRDDVAEFQIKYNPELRRN